MNIIKGLKKENIEALSNLWENEDFKKFVELLRVNQENCAKLCLTRTSMDAVLRLQEEARAYSIIIKIVEDCYLKINNIKRRKKS
jgi:mevalonate kinase